MDGRSASCGVDGVIITGDLDRRPSRAPDHEAENRALTSLAEEMSTNPGAVLQRLVEAAMELTRSDSAGISLLEPGGENGTFRWVATAGAWSPYRDGTMPREASPCGEVIAREAVLLMRSPERSFPALLQAEPGISEGLLAPFHLGGVPVGTVWTIKHGPDNHFEAEDARIIKSLARFASAAHQTVQALQIAEAASQRAEIRVQQLVALAELSSEFFGTCDMEFMPIYGNAAAMRLVGLTDLEQVKRTPVQEFFFPEDLPFITGEFLPRVLRDGQAKVEIRFRHFVTGEPVWVDYSLVVLKDKMGRATGLGTVTHDLTERKRAEVALRASEARFRALATVGSSSVYRMSPDWREMRNLDGAAFLADTASPTTDWIDSYIPRDERLRVREAVDRAIGAKDVFELEHRVLGVDGTVRWVFSRAIPLLDDVGEIAEWFGAATDVTARVKADQSFTRLFQASPALFLVVKPDAPRFTITEVNDAYLAATMRTRETVVGRGIFEAYPDNPHNAASSGVSTLLASLERVVASRQPDTLPGLKYDIARPDGTFEERWWNPVNSPVFDENGKVEAIIHNANDVTEERHAEAALRGSEERLRQFGEASQDILWMRDAETFQWTYLTPAFETVYGLDRASALRGDNMATWVGMIVPEDRERAVGNIRRVRDGEWVTFEYRIRRPADGEVRWLRNTDFPIHDRTGRVVHVGGVGHDVTAKKAAEEALAAAEHRQRLLLEGIPQLVWRSGDDGLCTWSSPQWQDFTGQSQSESWGWGWMGAVHPDDHEAARRAWHEALPHGRLDVEYRVRRARDGAWRWHATRSVPVRAGDGTDGRILEWLGTTTDIEDLKRYQAQQEVMVAELQHRTRNLLAVVRSVARRSIPSSPERDEYDSRLSALGRVQGFLSRSPLYTVSLGDLVEAELTATGNGASEKVVVGGPAVELPGEGVQAVALALHELATNAVKYGALAQASGRLSVTWRIEDPTGAGADGGAGNGGGSGDGGIGNGHRLVISWRESEVAMPEGPPTRRGYGSELITKALPYQLRAETALEFTHDGVRCRIALPAGAFTDGKKAQP